MNVVSLDNLLEGHFLEHLPLRLPEHEALDQFGYREDTVRGDLRYVGRDSNSRAIVGPVRHRAKGLLRIKKKKTAALPTPERTLNIRIDHEAVRQAGLAMQQHVRQMQESLETVDLTKLRTSFPPAPPQDPPSRWQRAKDAVRARFYDDEWHKATRNTAATILMWSFTAAAVLTLGKGVLWVLSV